MYQLSRKFLIGAAVVTLSGTAAATALASFPGQNGKIIFSSTRTGTNQLWSMDPKGRKPVQITRSTKLAHSNPTVSRDGRWITFERLGANQLSLEIYVVKLSGRKFQRLTSNAVADAAPSWAPDGKRIVFRSDRDGDPEIFVMNADGTAPVQVTNDPAIDALPSWSPDGQRLVFESRRSGNADIWTMAVDGTDLRQVTTGAAEERFPAYSPDGRRIVFERRNNVESRPTIWVMRTDGTKARRLTNLRSSNGTPDWQVRR